MAKLEEIADKPMSARSAAEFLDIGPDAFKKLAPKLPRCKLSEGRYVYLKSDLLLYLKARREAPAWFYREVG